MYALTMLDQAITQTHGIDGDDTRTALTLSNMTSPNKQTQAKE